jgi:CAAX protease family protein
LTHRDACTQDPAAVGETLLGIVGRVIERSDQGSDSAATADSLPAGTPVASDRAVPPSGGSTDPSAAWLPPPPTTPPPGWSGAPAWAPPAMPPPPPGAQPPPGEASGERDPASWWRSLGELLAAGAAPATRSAAWLWLLFAALGFLGGQIVAVVFVSITAAASGNVRSLSAIARLSEPPTWYIVSTLLGLWAVRGTGSLVRDLGLRFKVIDLIGIPIGIGGQILVGIVYLPIADHVHNFNQRFNAPGQRITGASHGLGYALVVLCTVIGAPFFEELFFRGLLLRALARLFGTIGRWVGPALAIVVSGILFGLAHAESLQLLGLAIFGVLLGFVSYRTGRLGMNMVAHATFNGMALLAVVAPVVTVVRPPF